MLPFFRVYKHIMGGSRNPGKGARGGQVLGQVYCDVGVFRLLLFEWGLGEVN